MKKGQVIAGLIWVTIIGLSVIGYRYLYKPAQKEAEQLSENQAEQELLKTTSSSSRFDYITRWAWDGFSGYSILRSPGFKNELAKHRIGITGKDDGADYNARVKGLQDGSIDFAVFTVDALVKASSNLGESPGVILWIIDESKGADAIVGYESKWKNIDSLNSEQTKFVIVPDSPSETLARIVMANFHMDRLSKDPFLRVNSSDEVYKQYRKNRQEDPYVYLMWEPDVSRLLENPNTHVIIDSSKFSGYIVDVVVVSRDFLAKNRDITQKVVECYFTSLYKYRDEMSKLVMSDAVSMGATIKDEQASTLVKKIVWRNTQENYVMFGLSTNRALPHIADVIENVTDVLVNTGGISKDPTNGKAELLYYDQILKNLFASNWHPGREEVRGDLDLASLSDAEWDKLRPVGTLKVDDLEFRRGTAKLSGSSRKTLSDLSQDLKKWPQYYLTLYGNASKDGNVEANKKLAVDRANETMTFLKEQGVSSNRVRVLTSDFDGSTVKFELGELPY